MVRLSFLPQDSTFFLLFEKSAQTSVKVAEHLRDMLQEWENADEKMQAITELEHEADGFTHEIIAQLHRTLITPFDREDIALLAHSLDNVTDFIEAAADSMLLYKVEQPTDKARELTDVLVKISVEVERAISEVKRSINLKKILERCIEINRLENVADRIYRSALAELFADERNSAFIIKWREIYEYMENAIDSCEDVADVLEGVALKYA